MAISDIHFAPIPFDRLTELADEMKQLAHTKENADVQGIIALSSEGEGGIVVFGFKDNLEAVGQLVMHIKAILQAEGKQFGVMTDDGFMEL